MKRIISLLLVLAVSLSCFTACGKKKEKENTEQTSNTQTQEVPLKDQVFRVDISMDNLFEYFEYKEYVSNYKLDDGTVSSVNISYGLELKDIYTAATDSKYKHNMKAKFTADVVMNEGEYQVDFDTLKVYGTTHSSTMQTVSHDLEFWAKGDRTTVWSYGIFSSTFANYLTNFVITDARGTIYLKYKYA